MLHGWLRLKHAVLFVFLLAFSAFITAGAIPDGPFSTYLRYDGITQAYPTNPVVFSSFTQVIETRTGGAAYARKSPGVTTWGNLILTVPVTAPVPAQTDAKLNTWFALPLGSPSRMKDAFLQIHEGDGTLHAAYMFYRMVPISRSTFYQRGAEYASYEYTISSFERDLEVMP